ncbi:MAG: vacuolar family H+-ATPase subunit H [Lachnospiraceae bacterium]|nr:vacuolar family H+-ATPase subunit H [Lachnospiraceae bacterium]
MGSKIEQLIDDIEIYIDNCKAVPLSKSNIVVNKEQMDEYLHELRMSTPDEIKRYQKIISNKEAILNDARSKAEALINEATIHTNKLISEHEIMQQAYAQANEVVTSATYQAQQILDTATMEANSVRSAAMQYMDDILNYLENLIVNASNNAVSNYENLLSGLNQYKDVIQSNRAELHPVEEDELSNVVLDNSETEEE